MLTIQSVESDPYAQSISSFYTKEFPGANLGNKGELLEVLTAAFISSGQIRYGPAPNPESLVSIRDVIRESLASVRAIPVLVPYGSRKLVLGEPLDVAEVGSLKQLACLNARVRQYWAPGITVNLRLEDASGHFLFAHEGEASRTATEEYCASFQKLVRILGYSGFIKPVLEKDLFDEWEYAKLSESMVPTLIAYMNETDLHGFLRVEDSLNYKKLKAFGWSGLIPPEQRDYYRKRYAVIYPGISDAEATMKLARYLAGSLARIVLQGVGAEEEWGSDYLRVTFAHPVPGAPVNLATRNIYYRTLPMKFATTHIPAWRGKGFLKINNDGSVIPKITSWQERTEYQPFNLLFCRGKEQVSVRADYTVSQEA